MKDFKLWLIDFREVMLLVPWPSLIFCVVLAFLTSMIIRWHLMPANKQRYDFSDLLKDEVTKKASLPNLVLIFFAGLSGWVVVELVRRDKPVDTLLLGVLAVFVTNGLVKRGINAYTATTESKAGSGSATEDSAAKK